MRSSIKKSKETEPKNHTVQFNLGALKGTIALAAAACVSWVQSSPPAALAVPRPVPQVGRAPVEVPLAAWAPIEVLVLVEQVLCQGHPEHDVARRRLCGLDGPEAGLRLRCTP